MRYQPELKHFDRPTLEKHYRHKSFETDIFMGIFDILANVGRGYLELNGAKERMESVKGFQFIPINSNSVIWQIYNAMEIMERTKVYEVEEKKRARMRYGHELPMRFLDAGCGIGNVLMIARKIASWIGINALVTGVEYDSRTADIAEIISGFSYDKFKVVRGNVFDFPDYDKLEIVYFYHPLRDQMEQIKFELMVFSSVKLGTIVIDNLGLLRDNYVYSERMESLEYKRRVKREDWDTSAPKLVIDGHVFEKVRNVVNVENHYGWQRIV